MVWDWKIRLILMLDKFSINTLGKKMEDIECGTIYLWITLPLI
jgi:hypothetical protein